MLTPLKNLRFLKNDSNKTNSIMIYTFNYYIEKVEGYLDKYIFLVYVYVKFNKYLISNYLLNFKFNIYPWNSIKFVTQNWNTYNNKFYSVKYSSINLFK